VTPCDPEYELARQEYNEAIDAYPAVIVYCFDPCDVANAILWSREEGIKLRVRSGGHNYEEYSTGTNKLVIDTTFMNDIKVDTADNTVEVRAGTRLSSLYERLYQYGYTFPGGTCPTVAISGLVLGGGIGLSTRFLGLTVDSLIEAEMVDARGKQLTANHDYNPELFWALRGAGGGNFGVVTGYKFRLLEKVNKITLIKLRWDNNVPARNQFLRVWQDWLPHLDQRMSAFGGIYKLGAWVNAFFYGRPNTARQILEPLLNIPGLTLENIEYVPFIDAVKIIGAGYPKREAFQTAGRFVYRHFSQNELENLFCIMDNAPSDRASSMRVYSLGGTVRDTETNATAFFYRHAGYIMAITSSWDSEDEATVHKEWVKTGFNYIYTITRGSYVNFPYSQTPNYERAYYGEHIGRLRCIKKEYDPHNIFSFPQSIRIPL
jgi:FAD/FMN-containing dehydrogenase